MRLRATDVAWLAGHIETGIRRGFYIVQILVNGRVEATGTLIAT